MYTFKDIPEHILKHEILKYFCKRVDITTGFYNYRASGHVTYTISYICDGWSISPWFDIHQDGKYELVCIFWSSDIREQRYSAHRAKICRDPLYSSLFGQSSASGFDIMSSPIVRRSVQNFMIEIYKEHHDKEYSSTDIFQVINTPVLKKLTQMNDRLKIQVMDIPLPDGYLNQIFNQN